MKDYGENKLTIGAKPFSSIIASGVFFGTPCIEIQMGDNHSLTNKILTEKLDDYPLLVPHVFFTYEDPTIFSEELWSFIKYYKSNGNKERTWHIITTGLKYNTKFLYEVDNILIDVRCPSSGLETPPEFIGWCVEDPVTLPKVEFRLVVNAEAKDITFARDQVNKLGTFKRPITIQQGSGWQSYFQFMEEFKDTLRYPDVRILPDLSILYT